MLTRKFLFGLAALAIASSSALVGCAVDAADADDETESADGELSAAGKALIGAYQDDSGSFRGLILTNVKQGQRNEFVADVDTGIRCITAPCPSSERIKGTFTAGSKTITLYSTTASGFSKHLLGRYKYLKQGDKFSLFRTNFSQSLEKVPSYCAEPADCKLQNLIAPRCIGAWTCSNENRCSYHCGLPSDPCAGLDVEACQAKTQCKPKFGPSACDPVSGICTADMAYKGCEKKPGCAGHDKAACSADPACQPVYGPSSCTPGGRCTRDMVYKGCADAPAPPPGGVQCGSVTCGAGLVCCNSSCGICTPPGGFCIQLACGPQ